MYRVLKIHDNRNTTVLCTVNRTTVWGNFVKNGSRGPSFKSFAAVYGPAR